MACSLEDEEDEDEWREWSSPSQGDVLGGWRTDSHSGAGCHGRLEVQNSTLLKDGASATDLKFIFPCPVFLYCLTLRALCPISVAHVTLLWRQFPPLSVRKARISRSPRLAKDFTSNDVPWRSGHTSRSRAYTYSWHITQICFRDLTDVL